MLKRNNILFTANGNGFTDQLNTIFADFSKREMGVVVRMVFFGNPSCHEEYHEHLGLIHNLVNQKFKNKPPTFTYIAQPPLGASSLIMEATVIIPDEATGIFYRRYKAIPYIIIEDPSARMLFLSGIKADYKLKVREQADSVFSVIMNIMQGENLPLSSVVRQWNYIPDITGVKDGLQNYQEFNDSRSFYFGKTCFTNGYPAATGIGTWCSGVSIDIDAMHTLDNSCKIFPVNNDLQVPAHFYSPAVLVGKVEKCPGNKTTPKFERAKVIVCGNKGIIFISGTAAIRGEKSTIDQGIERQTNITLDNIDHLISNNTLAVSGIIEINNVSVSSFRIYLKDGQFYDVVKNIIDKKYPGVQAVYLKGDVCRPELLIEIEALAFVELLSD
jgi:enamine deaminase RidA (YjgF/YER057c/UK114 family)